MNRLTQVKQATTSLTPGELRDLSAHIAALLAAEGEQAPIAEVTIPTNGRPHLTPGLNGRNNGHQPNWWEKDKDDAWWQGDEWSALREQVLGFARDEAQSPDSKRISLAGFPNKRALPRGCWLDGKEINGHGPYLYLRWRVGNRQRSKYLGKGKAPTPNPTPVAT
jgi:hypothetical protein